MREGHERAREVLSSRSAQMETMASVLLERETVEGEVVKALLDNTWDEYVAQHPEEARSSANTGSDSNVDADTDAETVATNGTSAAAYLQSNVPVVEEPSAGKNDADSADVDNNNS